jgi:hypothetical protein
MGWNFYAMGRDLFGLYSQHHYHERILARVTAPDRDAHVDDKGRPKLKFTVTVPDGLQQALHAKLRACDRANAPKLPERKRQVGKLYKALNFDQAHRILRELHREPAYREFLVLAGLPYLSRFSLYSKGRALDKVNALRQFCVCALPEPETPPASYLPPRWRSRARSDHDEHAEAHRDHAALPRDSSDRA